MAQRARLSDYLSGEMWLEESVRAPGPPVQTAREGAGHEADVAPASWIFQRDPRRHVLRLRQVMARQEWIVARMDEERGHLDAIQVALAARARPIVIGILESVQWRGH